MAEEKPPCVGLPSVYTSLYDQIFLLQYCSTLALHGRQSRQHPTITPTPTTSPARNLLTSGPTSTTSPTTSCLNNFLSATKKHYQSGLEGDDDGVLFTHFFLPTDGAYSVSTSLPTTMIGEKIMLKVTHALSQCSVASGSLTAPPTKFLLHAPPSCFCCHSLLRRTLCCKLIGLIFHFNFGFIKKITTSELI